MRQIDRVFKKMVVQVAALTFGRGVDGHGADPGYPGIGLLSLATLLVVM